MFADGEALDVFSNFRNLTADFVPDNRILPYALCLGSCKDSLIRSTQCCRSHMKQDLFISANRLWDIHDFIVVRVIIWSM